MLTSVKNGTTTRTKQNQILLRPNFKNLPEDWDCSNGNIYLLDMGLIFCRELEMIPRFSLGFHHKLLQVLNLIFKSTGTVSGEYLLRPQVERATFPRVSLSIANFNAQGNAHLLPVHAESLSDQAAGEDKTTALITRSS